MTALSTNDIDAKSAKKSTTVHVEFDSLKRQFGKKKATGIAVFKQSNNILQLICPSLFTFYKLYKCFTTLMTRLVEYKILRGYF